MRRALWDADWVTAMAHNYSLPDLVIQRLIEEFLAATDLTPEQYVAERHLTLHQAGMPNAEIYQVLQAEVEKGRFRTRPLSQRQVRRWIYG
ncbi:MAG: hypothetical protein HKM05_02955 [Spirochaetales bacterium]|nr:hypothetical protein [Spirochaetales bacterium]